MNSQALAYYLAQSWHTMYACQIDGKMLWYVLSMLKET
jgi:hypothetical protein